MPTFWSLAWLPWRPRPQRSIGRIACWILRNRCSPKTMSRWNVTHWILGMTIMASSKHVSWPRGHRGEETIRPKKWTRSCMTSRRTRAAMTSSFQIGSPIASPPTFASPKKTAVEIRWSLHPTTLRCTRSLIDASKSGMQSINLAPTCMSLSRTAFLYMIWLRVATLWTTFQMPTRSLPDGRTSFSSRTVVVASRWFEIRLWRMMSISVLPLSLKSLWMVRCT